MAAPLLVLTDFSKASRRALDYAASLAGPLETRLVLLHVRRDALLDPELLTGAISNRSPEALATALSSICSSLPVPAVAEVGHGQVASAVAEAVRRHHPALLVLGRPDYSDLPDELVHTTSLDILRTTPCPLLVVPHQLTSTAPPRRLLLAVDGEAISLGEHAGPLRHLLAGLGTGLTVLHVSAGPTNEATEHAVLDSVLRTGLTIDQPRVGIRTATNTAPIAGILAGAESGEFDMVALIARPRSFFGELFHRSVTAAVLLHSPVPVLVLPAR